MTEDRKPGGIGSPSWPLQIENQVPRVVITNGLLIASGKLLKKWALPTTVGLFGWWLDVHCPQGIVHGTFNTLPR